MAWSTLLLSIFAATHLAAALPVQSTELISKGTSGLGQNGIVGWFSASADGRFVAYSCSGSDVLPGDFNNKSDIFLYDDLTGSTILVAKTPSGGYPSDGAFGPAMSADGRYISYSSLLTDILPGLPGNHQRIFLYDRVTGTTKHVSVNSQGEAANGSSAVTCLSPDGRWIGLVSSADNLDPRVRRDVSQCYVHDQISGTTELISVTMTGAYLNDSMGITGLTLDGRYVMFHSTTSTLVPGDTNGRRDIFIRDRKEAKTSRISVGWNGAQVQGSDCWAFQPSLTWDGQLAVFYTEANNLVPGDTDGYRDVFLLDLSAKTIRKLTNGSGFGSNGHSHNPVISGRGQYVAFGSSATNHGPPDTNNFEDIYRWSSVTSSIERVSLTSAGAETNGASQLSTVSATGERYYFTSTAPNLGATNGYAQLYLRVSGHVDFDVDGVPDDLEVAIGTLSDDVDSDDDGLGDHDELTQWFTDPAQSDSETDGIQDGTEVGATSGLAGNPGGGIGGTNLNLFQPDLDPGTTTIPWDADSDDDGLADGTEDLDADGARLAFETAADGFDTDEDGLGDGLELGVSIGLPSTAPEIFVPDVDPASQTNPILSDSDGGGIADGQEDENRDGGYTLGESDPNAPDDDYFGLRVLNLVRGQSCSVRCEAVKPGSWVTTGASLSGAGPITLNGIVIYLTPPITRFDPIFATPSGIAEFTLNVPRSLTVGASTYWHAVEVFDGRIIRTSDPVTAIVQ